MVYGHYSFFLLVEWQFPNHLVYDFDTVTKLLKVWNFPKIVPQKTAIKLTYAMTILYNSDFEFEKKKMAEGPWIAYISTEVCRLLH